jgi:hypothetical protein
VLEEAAVEVDRKVVEEEVMMVGAILGWAYHGEGVKRISRQRRTTM